MQFIFFVCKQTPEKRKWFITAHSTQICWLTAHFDVFVLVLKEYFQTAHSLIFHSPFFTLHWIRSRHFLPVNWSPQKIILSSYKLEICINFQLFDSNIQGGIAKNNSTNKTRICDIKLADSNHLKWTPLLATSNQSSPAIPHYWQCEYNRFSN